MIFFFQYIVFEIIIVVVKSAYQIQREKNRLQNSVTTSCLG